MKTAALFLLLLVPSPPTCSDVLTKTVEVVATQQAQINQDQADIRDLRARVDAQQHQIDDLIQAAEALASQVESKSSSDEEKIYDDVTGTYICVNRPQGVCPD